MFELGTLGEIAIIVVAALIFIGPKELPTVLRAFGRWMQKARRMSSHLRSEFDKYVHEGEFEEYRRQANELLEIPDETRKKTSKGKPRDSKKKK